MKIALLQINPTVGDLEGNARLIADAAREAGRLGADLAVTPELALVGYLPRDLLLSGDFVARSWERLERARRDARRRPADARRDCLSRIRSDEGRPLFNTAALLRGGSVEHRFRKALLPTYDVFDEDRYFEPFHGAQTLDIAGRRLGISICEDVWNDRDFWKRRRYHHDPVEELVRAGAEAIVNLSASPFYGRQAREARKDARRAWPPSTACRSCTSISSAGTTTSCSTAAAARSALPGIRSHAARSFDRDVVICDLASAAPIGPATDLEPESEIWRALVLGTRDYARKCGFSRVVLGLSGGIDSALTAAIASEALGAPNVLGVLMPSPYSSRGSVDDSLALAAHLGIHTLTLPIDDVHAGHGQHASRRVRGDRARRDGGKHSGAHPRQPADGAFEQASARSC